MIRHRLRAWLAVVGLGRFGDWLVYRVLKAPAPRPFVDTALTTFPDRYRAYRRRRRG